MSRFLFRWEADHLFKGLLKKKKKDEEGGGCEIFIVLFVPLSFPLPVCGGTVSTHYSLIIWESGKIRRKEER